MWKQRPAARFLPAQTVAEPGGLDRDEQQPGLSGAVPAGALAQLRRGREMDEPVAPIVLRALIASGGNRRFPCLCRAHVIDDFAHAVTIPQPPARAESVARDI